MSTSTLKITIANFFAKNSCITWQKNHTIRKICHAIHCFIMETGTKDYPYGDTDFANWSETEDTSAYSTISDSSNLPIRRSPSYINWLVKKKLGQRLKLDNRAFEARHWDEILKRNGWELSKRGPEFTDISSGKHYIGIIPDKETYGQLVWFMGNNLKYSPKLHAKYIKNWIVATYEKDEEKHCFIPTIDGPKVIWYAK